MSKGKIPTIVGFIILVIGIASGVLLLQSKQIFKIGASADYAPKNVRVSNIGDTSFAVSWITEKAAESFVAWGESEGSLGNVEKDQLTPAGFTHYALIKSLAPEKSYYFVINSQGDNYDNNKSPWLVKTGPAIAAQPKAYLASGSVIAALGAPAANSLVYIQVSGYLLSTVSSQNGTWVIPLSWARTANLSGYLPINPSATLLGISVDAGALGAASASIYPQSTNPIPALVLGKVYDFKSLPANNSQDAPKANVNLTESANPEVSGFDVPDEPIASQVKPVTLDSTKEAEIVGTTKPEFFGGGPSGTTISITLHSETVTDSVKVSDSGSWRWSPPDGLSEGSHSITLSWKDAGGIIRSLTRTFVVQAASLESPAFVSTPSASLTPSPSPTPTIRPTPTPTPVPTPTSPPTPVSGNLTPTLLLFIMGIGVMFFSLLVWKQAEE